MRETDDPLDSILDDVMAELDAAMSKFPPFNTAHEGYAVLLEEVDELWEQVRIKQGMRLTHAMRREAVQCAAMALRFALDCCGSDGKANK
jgi:hypothetical protein